jgi:hypothetical protein
MSEGWKIHPLAHADALIAFPELDLAEIVFRHELDEILDRADVERPGRVPFFVGHRETPKRRRPSRRLGSGY